MVSNIFYFHPYLGKIPILTNVFQRGWNHQLESAWLFLSLICFFWLALWFSEARELCSFPVEITSLKLTFFWALKIEQRETFYTALFGGAARPMGEMAVFRECQIPMSIAEFVTGPTTKMNKGIGIADRSKLLPSLKLTAKAAENWWLKTEDDLASFWSLWAYIFIRFLGSVLPILNTKLNLFSTCFIFTYFPEN